MKNLSGLINQIRNVVKGKNLVLFEEYSAAVRTAEETGKAADIAAARALGDELTARFPAPVVGRNTNKGKSAPRK